LATEYVNANGAMEPYEEDDDVEPSMELPVELREYRGDPHDADALAAFQAAQHDAYQVWPKGSLQGSKLL
jgi:hypothetical protein